jgi:hypothetical protein
MQLVEESTPSEKEKDTADTAGAGNVEAPAQPLEVERERVKKKTRDDCSGEDRREKEENR